MQPATTTKRSAFNHPRRKRRLLMTRPEVDGAASDRARVPMPEASWSDDAREAVIEPPEMCA
jgi:hypothetical protein